jgi:hypothetical protein
METSQRPARVELKIFTPRHPVRFVSASLSGQIHSLQSLWTNEPQIYIFAGMELAEEKTFSYYGIAEGDSIIALPRNDPAPICRTHLWLNSTRDTDNFNECVCSLLNPATSAEAARLRDLAAMRRESRGRWFLRTCARFQERYTQEGSRSPTQIARESPEGPSTRALPVLWNLAQVQLRFGETGIRSSLSG